MSKPPKLELVSLRPQQLQPNPRNPRTHPKTQIENLAASIKKFGQPRPILARKANSMIIAGEGIWRALSELNLPCAVRLWDIDQKTADAYMLADNEHPKGATDDEDRVAAILREIEASEYGALGFSEKEARRLLGGGDDAALEILEVPIETVADQFWISLRGPLKDQASTLQELRKLMAKYPNVQIEIGTLELAS